MQDIDSRRDAGVSLTFLGAAVVKRPDGSPVSMRATTLAALALLALRGPQRRDWLASMLYPRQHESVARNAFRKRVADTRTRTGHELLLGDHSALWLSPTVHHDLIEPMMALKVDPGASAGELLAGLGFPDHPDLSEVIEVERRRWRARVQDALLKHTLDAAAARHARLAVRYATRLVNEQPLSDQAVRLLMEQLERNGEPAAAFEQFEAFKARLHHHLGIAPEDETVAQALQLSAHGQGTAASAPDLPEALRRPLSMVGHDALFERLRRRLEQGLPVLVTGPSGIGKTRMFEELVAALRPPVVVPLRADDSLAGLELLSQLARRIQAWITSSRCALAGREPTAEIATTLRWLASSRAAEAPAGLMTADRMAALVRGLLQHARRAGVGLIAIDNLQFADPESLELLAPVLAGAVRGADADLPNWLLTCREPFPPALEPWLDRPIDPQEPGDLVAELPALSATAVQALLRSMALPALRAELWAPALHAHCGGEPMALLRVLRVLHASGRLGSVAPPAVLPVPQDYGGSVRRLLDRIDDASRKLAFVGAIAGSDFDPALASKVMKGDDAALLVPWHRLERLAIFRGAGFNHELVRQAVLAAVPEVLVPGVHRQVAQALTDMDAAFDRRARHWLAAGETLLAAGDTERAAHDLLRAGLHIGAGRRLIEASALFETAGRAQQALECRVAAAEASRYGTSAEQATEQLHRLLRSPLDARQRVRTLCVLVDRHLDEQEAQALPFAAEAVQLALQCGDHALLARARCREAAARRALGETEASLAILTAAMTEVDALGAREQAEVRFQYAKTLATHGRRDEAIALTLRLLDEAVSAGDAYHASDYANAAAVHCGCLNRLQQALDLTERAIALSCQAGVEPSHLLVDEMNLASYSVDVAHLSRALDVGCRVLADMRRVRSGWVAQCEIVVASVYKLLGRTDRALQVLPEAPADASTWQRAFRRHARAKIEFGGGPACREALELGLLELDAGGVVLGPDVRLRLELELSRYLEPAVALREAARCRQLAIELQFPPAARHASMCEVEAALSAGQPALAAAAADRLVADIADGPWDTYSMYLPELWGVLVRAWDAAGQVDKADAMAEHAAAWIHGRAEEHVPAAYRESFLEGNRFNAWLLERAAQAGGPALQAPTRATHSATNGDLRRKL
jgi:DNA-binding SARP family transcriptional activator/tetratricopeptide (TPR) repeat protein